MRSPASPERAGRVHVLSAIACFGPCTRRTLELKCDRHYGMTPREVGERLAELAECGIVDTAGRQELTGDTLWIHVERTQYEGDGK